MKKTYKHKKLGYIITEQDDSYEYDRDGSKTAGSLFYIPKELIENSDDWELQEEKDWIDKMFEEYSVDFEGGTTKEIVREAIEERMLKITRKDINLIQTTKYSDIHFDELVKLLKDKGLYKDD